MNKDIHYSINTIDLEGVQSYLTEREGDLTPSLSEKLDIPQFAYKMHSHANIYTAHDHKDLVGLVGCYANNYDTLEAYVNHISVAPAYYGIGLAQELVEYCLNDIEARGFKTVKLEVRKDNARALNFYKKIGFILSDDESKSGSLYMVKGLEE